MCFLSMLIAFYQVQITQSASSGRHAKLPTSGVDPGGGEGGDSPPNKNIPGREYLFAPLKF